MTNYKSETTVCETNTHVDETNGWQNEDILNRWFKRVAVDMGRNKLIEL